MIAKDFANSTIQQTGQALNTRLLGTLGMLASPMMLVEALYAGFQQHGTDQVIGALGVIYMGGWMCSILGLRALNATGQGRIGRALLIIQLISLSIAALWSGHHLFTANPQTEHMLYILTDLFWPLSHLFMIVVGVATLVAGKLQGWRRFTPLLCGLALPAAIISSIIAGETALGIVFSTWTMIAFALLGYTVRTSRDA
jgi:hypothetical protein